MLLRRSLKALGALLLLVLVGWIGIQVWLHHRPAPPAVDEELFEGVHYTRSIRTKPRRIVVHVVAIRLDAPGIEFLVTPGNPSLPLPFAGKTTSAFLREHHLQIAINASFFKPWHSRTLWDYYPHVGDPVRALGLTASRGAVVKGDPSTERYPVLNVTADNKAVIAASSPPHPYNAVSGVPVLIRQGRIVSSAEWEHTSSPAIYALNPRTAIGVSKDGKRLILLLVDGRQPGYSEGASLPEMAGLLVEYGAYNALNVDGGGSTTLVAQGSTGEPEVLNCPIDRGIPGQERAVATHLGVSAQPAVAGAAR